MVQKFLDFDEYQLAKYNRTKKVKNKLKLVNKSEVQNKAQDETSQPFTLKSLVRQLHIAKPAYHVMCIIGKKYPETIEKFYLSGISGTWNSELAGKRMKLKTPITWETQVSAKGNQAKVWQDLIDSKSLPYMATLRNVRNMIKAGISHKHHDVVIKYITNRTAVTKSRQFPFRFLSAYEVVEDLSSDITKQKTYKEKGWTVFLPKPLLDIYTQCGKKINKLDEVQKKQVNTIKHAIIKKYSDTLKYTGAIVERYKKAFGVALDIATSDNLTPIKGRTLIACDVSAAMRVQCGILQKGSKRKLHEIAILFGLMCYSASEDCTMLIYGCGKIIPVEIEKGGILSNLQSILNLCECLDVHCTSSSDIWHDFLEQLYVERDQWDNFIVISKEINPMDKHTIFSFLERYRSRNGSIMFYDIELSGKSARFGEEMSGCPNNIKVCGFSDHLLRYIACGGGDAQLFYVENVDKKWGLPPQDEDKLHLPLLSIEDVPTSFEKFETIKIFLSSTLKDMVGERNILSKFVFPELRRRGAKLGKNIVECDFTWGIPDVSKKHLIQLCLTEIKNCQLFVGIVGDRYGWIPNPKDLPSEECIPANLTNKSITELEIYQGMNCISVNRSNRVFMYLRGETAKTKKNVKKHFAESASKNQKLQDLRNCIANFEHCESYDADWTISTDGKPVACDLTQFAEMVLSDLWNAVCAYSEVKNTSTNRMDINHANQEYLSEYYSSLFVGVDMFMKKITYKLHAALNESHGETHILYGPKGCGKTSVLAKLSKIFEQQSDRYLVVKHFVGFTPQTEHSTKYLLDALSYQLKLHLKHKDLQMNGESLKDSIDLFWHYIKLLKKISSKQIMVVVDDIDALLKSKAMNNLQWIQSNPADGVIFILSCIEKGFAYSLLQQQKHTYCHKIPYLHGRDSAAVVRKTLSVYSKKLNEQGFDNQLRKLLLKHESYRPIYLKLACEFLRLFGEYSTLDLMLHKLPGDVNSLLHYWLETVEHYVNDAFLISATLCIISCMPAGIEEEDLYHLINWLKWYYDESELERSRFCQIKHLISPFVYQPKTTKLMFNHTMHLEAVKKRYKFFMYKYFILFIFSVSHVVC
uniref:Telomerase protein component 1-like n=1 Tax=Phallusia mammillata TaxID=59560 RepID=A0A6F9DJ15_9ASCI|nr:telomerase protein component 1-like [Phallusia mammillata]